MIRDLQSSVESFHSTKINGRHAENVKNISQSTVDANEKSTVAKQHLSLIGKARVTCGTMNLLRILSHETIVQICSKLGIAEECDTSLNQAFTYRSQGGKVDEEESNRDSAMEIIVAIMAFLSSIGSTIHQQGVGDNGILSIPELYDVMVQIFLLLLVLLSTQLYRPMGQSHCFLQKWMTYAHWQRMSSYKQQHGEDEHMRQQQAQNNGPLLFLQLCLQWFVDRPLPPRRSIAFHYVDLPKSIAQQMTNLVVAPDGMYESHSIVMASAPLRGKNKVALTTIGSSAVSPVRPPSLSQGKADTANQMQQNSAISLGTDDAVELSSPGHVSWNAPSSMLLRPIRSILLLSSSFLFLPVRLVRLALNLLGPSQRHSITESDHLILQQLHAQSEKQTGWNKTNNVLWLSESPIADLASALVLILSNNQRDDESSGYQNPFRAELESLRDNRWSKETENVQAITENSLFPPSEVITIDFESLFKAFGLVVHTEVGALTLYTLILSSPNFAEFLSARLDLDELIIPLLRSLYFSTTMADTNPNSIRKNDRLKQLSQLMTLTPGHRPFRAQGALYVILILLLIFSQDPSFGRDSFRRVHVSPPTVRWYKERTIKEASLGSMILLVLLKAITFNLNQLQDEFLLSNCFAVLLNLSPHIVDLNEYVSSRLVAVTTSCFKRYKILMQENGGEPEVEGELSTLLGMHGEVRAPRVFIEQTQCPNLFCFCFALSLRHVGHC